MKKTFMIATIAGLIISSCNTKNNTANPEKNATSLEAKDTLTDVERLEGKVVMSVNGEWYVIKNGQRWIAMSEPATTDYLNSIINGQDNVVKNVSDKTLEQFPIAGEIFPKLEFKKYENKTTH